jgi:hypothetical protein
MSEMLINVEGYLSDVKPGDTLYFATSDDKVIEVTVVNLELTLDEKGYSPYWITCKWYEGAENDKEMEDSISVCCLFKTKEEALKYLMRRYMDYINSIDDRRAEAKVKLMDLEEQITQLHV